jgi:hypothetical protein
MQGPGTLTSKVERLKTGKLKARDESRRDCPFSAAEGVGE